jgi:hypothetical protein
MKNSDRWCIAALGLVAACETMDDGSTGWIQLQAGDTNATGNGKNRFFGRILEFVWTLTIMSTNLC